MDESTLWRAGMISQFAIAFTGFVSIWLSQDTRVSWRKWACVFGLVGEPFWFYVTYTTEQWGIFVLAVFYTIAWGKGAYAYWLKPMRKEIRDRGKVIGKEQIKEKRWWL
jgi:uncharacterized iron-regulated membrane protein